MHLSGDVEVRKWAIFMAKLAYNGGWVYVVYAYYVGPAKLYCVAAPPSLMVLLMVILL